MNYVQLVLGFGLGAGLMAIIYETCRWDLARRRLAGELAAAAAPGGAYPPPEVMAEFREVMADEPPEEPSPGRHRRGEDTDILDMRARSFAAGLAARATGPVSTDPADHGWQRPSTMIPDAGPPVPVMLPEVPVLPVWDGSGQKIGVTA